MNLHNLEFTQQLKHSVYYTEAGYVKFVRVQHVGLTIFETNIMV